MFVPRSLLPFALTLAFAAPLALPAPATAQRLVVRSGTFLGMIDAASGRVGRVISVVDTGCGGQSTERVWVIDYGRYLAWDGQSGQVCLFDVSAGKATTLPDTGTVVAVSPTSFRLVTATRPGQLRIRTTPQSPGLVVDVPQTIPRITFPWWAYAYAAGSDSVVVVEGDYNDSLSIQPLRSPTFRLVSATTGTIGPTSALAVSPLVYEVTPDASGARLAVLALDAGFSPQVAVLDAATGALLSSTTSIAAVPAIAWTTRALTWFDDRLLVITLDSTAPQVSLDAVDAQTLASPTRYATFSPQVPLRQGMRTRSVSVSLAADPVSGTVVAVELEQQQDGSTFGIYPAGTRLAAADLRAEQVIGTLDLERAVGVQAAFAVYHSQALIGPPAAPTAVSANVSGNTVTLSWTPSPGATHVTIEAGSAPGRANLGAVSAAGASWSATGVPPGTYYLRARSTGVGGQGPRSNDVVVTVP